MMRDALLTVLRDTRLLLARPENDFTWSSWENAEAALREIDALIAIVSKGAWPDRRQLAVCSRRRDQFRRSASAVAGARCFSN